jgi:uncharacterized membrane protein (DUF373 family)
MSRDVSTARSRWRAFTAYERFEHVVVIIVTALMAIIIVSAVWNLVLRILFGLVLVGGFDPTDHEVFQTVFGMIFTVIIALEFRRSLIVVAESRSSIVQVRTVVLLAMLAIVRKLIILDLKSTDAALLFGLAAAMLALGVVYWTVRDQDWKERQNNPGGASSPRPGQTS